MAAPYLQCALEVGKERGKQACGWAVHTWPGSRKRAGPLG